MKFNTLIIHNIASIADATIDFEDPMLANEPLFLICGETGSGKSTILDAVCLALYKKTPRMEQCKSDAYVDDSLTIIKNDEKQVIQVKDPRQYLRRGASEGSVSLTFEGNDGKKYKASLSFSYTRTNNLKAAEWLLETDDRIFAKDKEIEAAVLKVTGLDFSQFCRTTMLAQGEFTKFLKSSESEKTSILEKLTGTEIYSEIGKQIAAIAKRKKDAYEFENAKMEGVVLLSDEEIATCNDDLLSLSKQKELKDKELVAINSKKDWIDRNLDLENAVVQNKSKVENAQNLVDADAETKALIISWRNAADARAALQRVGEIEIQISENQRKEADLSQRFAELVSGEHFREEMIKQKNAELQDLLRLLRQQENKKAMFADCQSIAEILKSYLSEKELEKKNTDNALKCRNRLPGFEKSLEKAKSLQADAEKKKSEKQEEIQTKQAELDALDRQKLNDDFSRISTELSNVAETKTKVEASRKAIENLRKIEKNYFEIQQIIINAEKQSDELKPQIETALKAKTEAEALFEQMKDSVDKAAKAMRAKLHAGDKCPVCGQTVQSVEHDEAFEQALKPIREAMETKRKEYDALNEKLNKSIAEIRANQKPLSDALREKDLAKKSLGEAAENAKLACEKLQLNVSDELVLQKIEELENQEKTKKGRVEAQIKLANVLQKQIDIFNRELTVLNENLKKAIENVAKEQKTLDAEAANVGKYESLAQQNATTASNALRQVAGKIVYPDWQKDVKSTLAVLEKEAEAYGDCEKQCQVLQNELGMERISQNAARQQCALIMKSFPNWKSDGETREVKNLNDAWTNLQTESAQLKAKMDSASKEMQKNQEILNVFYASYPEIDAEQLKRLSAISNAQIVEKENFIKRNEELLNTCKGALSQIQSDLEKHLQKRPKFAEGEDLDALKLAIATLTGMISEITERIGGINERLNNDKKNKQQFAALQESVEALAAESNKWEDLAKIFGDNEGRKFRKIAQSYVLGELLEKANFYLNQLSERYEMDCPPDSLTILVRDRYNGNVERPADMLSGGESFVVSLALALGLSSLGNNTFSADVLFIDEGFGTLDAAILEDVMATLNRLHEIGNRRVGIISHVETLRERIPVKIVVEKVNNTTSEIRLQC